MKALGVNSLPDNPSANGYSASQIKGAISKPTLRLFDLLKGIADGSIALIDSDPSGLSAAVLSEYDGQLVVCFDADTKDCSVYYIEGGTATQIGESFKTAKEKLSELFSYFADGRANKAMGDADGDAIKDAYAHSISSSGDATSGDTVSIYSKNGGSLGSVGLTNAHHAHNADNASKATKDGNGNVITETYATKKELSETNWMSNLTALRQALSAETGARSSKDDDLQTQIDSEAAARKGADDNLQAQIDAVNATQNVVDIVGTYAELAAYDASDLHANDKIEVLADERRDDADAIYSWDGSAWSLVGSKAAYYSKSEVDARHTGQDNALSTEITRAKGVESNLQSQITSEASTRANKDAELEGKITSEASTRSTADIQLQTNIDSEATTRANADTALGTRVDNESADRKSADAALRKNIDSEASTREGADTQLQTNIDNESSAREGADTALGNRITNEATARSTADTTLQANIDGESTARKNADADLQSQIDAINQSQNFVATVSTYASLSIIATANLDTEDCVLVLQDENHDSQAYVYKWNGTSFAGVGPLGDSYTKSETDTLLGAEKTARESADTALGNRVTTLEGKAIDSASASATTLAAGSSATASVGISNGAARFSFGIPKGDKGDKGDTGSTGVGISSVEQTTTSTADGGSNVWTITLTDSTTASFTILNGSKGSTGAQGEAGSITINNVETLPAGSSAYVTNVGDSQNAILNIGIPKGADYDSSVLAGYLPLTGGRITGQLTSYMPTGSEPGFIATDSGGVSVGLVVGADGVNHGLWSYALNKWMIYGDSSNIYLNGNATYATSAGSANTALSADSAGFAVSSTSSSYSSFPEGFGGRNTSAPWGVQTGTVITTWEDGSGGSVAWRKNCPDSGETSLMIDGRFYQDEGRYMCLDTSNYGSYAIPKTSYEEWTFTLSDGTTVTKKVAIV